MKPRQQWIKPFDDEEKGFSRGCPIALLNLSMNNALFCDLINEKPALEIWAGFIFQCFWLALFE